MPPRMLPDPASTAGRTRNGQLRDRVDRRALNRPLTARLRPDPLDAESTRAPVVSRGATPAKRRMALRRTLSTAAPPHSFASVRYAVPTYRCDEQAGLDQPGGRLT
jgi:hypothetical protein